MKLNQRTTLWGAILAVLLIFLALRLDVPPVVIVLLFVVAALAGLVAYSRRNAGAEDDEWDEGDRVGPANRRRPGRHGQPRRSAFGTRALR